MLKFIGKSVSIITFLILGMFGALLAQSPSDSLINKWVIRDFRVGTDLIGLGKTAFDSDKTEFEINAEMGLRKFVIGIDIGGLESHRLNEEKIDYTTSGNYFRIGLDFNTVRKEIDKSVIFIGMRYGRSFYKENLKYIDNNYQSVWGTLENELSNDNMTASWFELVGGMKVKVWKKLWMGYTGRIKLGLNHKEGNFKSYEIPGYGRNTKNVYYGFNYQIYYNLNFR